MCKFVRSLGVDVLLARKDYHNTESIDLDHNLDYYHQHPERDCGQIQIKQSNKCRCFMHFVEGVNVEYRAVDVQNEQKIEREHQFIRNFVLHADGMLRGGWSKESIVIPI